MKNIKIIDSFKYAFMGIYSAFKSERNMKIHVMMLLLVIVMGVLLNINMYEWIICINCFSLVIGAEMFNTAIEAVVDLAMPDIHDWAKLAKDVAAGAVLICAIGAATIGLIIFVPKIIKIFM